MQTELFESASVPKAYMKLALPVVMSMMVSLVYNMVDTYFIALTGKQELVAGVSLAAPIFTLIIAFGDIFGLGGKFPDFQAFWRKTRGRGKAGKRVLFVGGDRIWNLCYHYAACISHADFETAGYRCGDI